MVWPEAAALPVGSEGEFRGYPTTWNFCRCDRERNLDGRLTTVPEGGTVVPITFQDLEPKKKEKSIEDNEEDKSACDSIDELESKIDNLCSDTELMKMCHFIPNFSYFSTVYFNWAHNYHLLYYVRGSDIPFKRPNFVNAMFKDKTSCPKMIVKETSCPINCC
ncbi:hypothetical protein PHYBLDRAFT_61793 [Phycomyces blakesleeanus NRRL 1555(-)]|uniref:Uncharacterized protein n=1 Tax=Phycomyces blakesleeanus (strain ATCC 8743b / DSM 1359 / FGSC 10004 / NBRC 33097 / NRRL 1555) TaxID=763407 RepID=A0A162V821_PHYB8|nr:hypothetical protein PHYBLDRAFT_61793 [Phycomyces blakesleeanus NRRL 1555(-)]OAD80743.1 hypothetical protein PHYBLDRAFT_61793 [Phycomyces blakesleeanus NRRL 1555(-)]|eukprot:XP_018298783.1 hypothetical protein PHYBLDRAFT_61793 [Phycomyces blakesleeanus NRRL 1555(-)]